MGDASSFSAADVSFDDMAAMLFTSGTTGNPKLVSLSHLNILHVACVCTELEEYSPSDVTLALLPLFHIYALEATFMAPMVSGSSIVMLNSLKGPDIMKALADFPITIFPAARLCGAFLYGADGQNRRRHHEIQDFHIFRESRTASEGPGPGFPGAQDL
jgi:acyl-CoA synthetase (AMP-forming)/AMP-acid ligase II